MTGVGFCLTAGPSCTLIISIRAVGKVVSPIVGSYLLLHNISQLNPEECDSHLFSPQGKKGTVAVLRFEEELWLCTNWVKVFLRFTYNSLRFSVVVNSVGPEEEVNLWAVRLLN